MLNWHNFIMTTQIVKEYDQIFSLIVRRNSRFQVKHISARWVRYFHSFCYVTYARIGDIAEGVKVADPSGTYVLNLKPGVPPNDQGENLVVFFNDLRRHYEVVPVKHSCGAANMGWVRLEEKEK